MCGCGAGHRQTATADVGTDCRQSRHSTNQHRSGQTQIRCIPHAALREIGSVGVFSSFTSARAVSRMVDMVTGHASRALLACPEVTGHASRALLACPEDSATLISRSVAQGCPCMQWRPHSPARRSSLRAQTAAAPPPYETAHPIGRLRSACRIPSSPPCPRRRTVSPPPQRAGGAPPRPRRGLERAAA